MKRHVPNQYEMNVLMAANQSPDVFRWSVLKMFWVPKKTDEVGYNDAIERLERIDVLAPCGFDYLRGDRFKAYLEEIDLPIVKKPTRAKR